MFLSKHPYSMTLNSSIFKSKRSKPFTNKNVHEPATTINSEIVLLFAFNGRLH